MLRYTNTKGEEWAYPLWQMLLHQVNHATQHRSEFSDDLVVTYKTSLNLPANSRCAFQLGLWCDVTAVGPRNGRWNRFICNSQVQASANIPRIDVDVWPLV